MTEAISRQFRKFDHVERLGHPEVRDLTIGKVYVFPKLDGAVWLDDLGNVQCASRNRVLSLDADNHGFCAWIHSDAPTAAGLKAALTFSGRENWVIYGEWMIPHTLKTYRSEIWNKFWIFDVFDRGRGRYLPYEEYALIGQDQGGGQHVIEPICTIQNPGDEQLQMQVELNTYLIADGAGLGEGIVVKNYCPTPDQLVLKADLTWIPCGLLVDGDELLGIEESGQALPSGRIGQRRFCSSMVVKVDPGVEEIICITLSDGTKLNSTPGHPWLINRKQGITEWRNAQDVRPGWKMRRLFSTWGDQVQDYNTGWLSAFYDGEGCITNDDYDFIQVSCSQVEGPVLEELKERIHRAGFEFYETSGGSSNVKNVVIVGGKREELRFLGLIRPKRLLSKFSVDSMGTIKSPNNENLEVISIEHVGRGPIVQLSTTSRTFIQEGFASHNSWSNLYGRQPWAKIVRNEFKERNRRAFGTTHKEGQRIVESEIAEYYVTPAFVGKTRAKVVADVANEEGIDLVANPNAQSDVEHQFRHRVIPQLLGRAFHDLVIEESWTFVKKWKNPTVNFKLLQSHVIAKVKEFARDMF